MADGRPGFEQRYVAGLLRLRVLVLVVITGLTVAAGAFAVRVGFAADIESWFVEGDASLVKYHAFLDKFGADEVSVVGVFGDDLFTTAHLEALDAFTRAAEEAPYTFRVRSLTNARVVKRLGPGHVGVEAFLEDLPETEADAQAARTAALADPLLRGNLLSDDARATAVVVELTREGNTFAAKIEHVQALRALMEKHLAAAGLEAHLAGSPSLDDAMFTATERDFGLFGPLGAGVLVLMMLVLFRRFSAVVVPLSVVTIASVWLFGLMGLLGIEITLISSSLVVLIMAVGVADSVHVLSDYYQALMHGESRDAAVRHAVAALLVPCLFTSLTTAAGFLSLLVGDLQPIREFGWLAAVGVMFAFVLSMTFVPCLLALVSPPPPKFIEAQRTGRVSRLLRALGRPSRRARRGVLLAGAVVVLGSAALITRLNTAANPLNYFLPGAPVRVALEKVDAALAGSTSFEFLAQTSEDGLKDPRVLARLDAFAVHMASLEGVPRVLSVLDLLRETRKALTDGEQPGLPTTADHPHLAAQLYFFLEGDEDFPTLVRDGYSLARLTARVRMSLANDVTRAGDRIDAWIAEAVAPIPDGPPLAIESTGYVKLMADMERYLFQSQVESLTVAFIVITLMMFLLLRSVKLGLLAMIPNGLPIVFGLGFMALVDIALDPGTIMIGSMALGLVVDDTVHFLVRLRRNLGEAAMPAAIERTMAQTGRPIIVTSVVLALGFATLGFGSFTPNVAFGVVSAVVILCAVLADLLLLPAVLLVGKKDA